MPVQFLSDGQARRYGSFHGDPSAEQLSRFFSFGPAEQEDINRHRNDRARLGYAVQLGCVRFLGCFPDLAATPASVVSHVADGVGVEPAAFATYPTSRTRFAHAVDIRTRYGYTAFGEGLPHGLFLQWLDNRVWTAAERPTVLVDLATAWLVEHKVLLPGITTLTRLIAEVRDRAARRSWRIVGAQVDDGDGVRLEHLLDVEAETGLSLLERLRRPPRSPTIDGLVGALNRLGEVQRVAGPRRLRLDGLAPGRVRALAADAATAKTQRLSQRTPERRLASLACFADRLLAEAHDDVIDVLLIVVHDLASRSERAVERDRMRTLDQLDAAAVVLRKAALVVLEPDVADADLRSTIFALTAREELQRAVDVVGELLGAGPDQALQRLLARYPHVRRFLPALLDRVRFASVTASHPVIAALDHLRALEVGAEKADAAPRSVITEAWRPLVVVEGRVDRRGYTLCVLDRLRLALRRRDVYVVDGDRWGDPRRLLVEPTTWRSVGPQVMRTLDLPDRAPSYLDRLGAELDDAYFAAADAVAKDPTMWIEESGHRDRVHVAHLDRLSEPASTSDRSCGPAPMRCSPRSSSPSCCWRCTPGPDSWTTSPMPPVRRHASMTWPSACARYWWPKPATSAIDPSHAVTTRPSPLPASSGSSPTSCARRRSWPPTIASSLTTRPSTSPGAGAAARSGQRMGCASWCPCAPSTPAPTPTTSEPGGASPTTTGPPISSPRGRPSSSRAPCATANSSSMGCSTTPACCSLGR